MVNLVIVIILKVMVEVNLKSVICRNSQYFRNNVLLVCLEGREEEENTFK